VQFEAGSTLARESTNPNDFALVVMLGLLGLRIFEATGASIDDLGDAATASCARAAKATKWCSSHSRQLSPSGEKRG